MGSQWMVPEKNSMEEELTRVNDVKIRWREYFGQLPNGDAISEVRDRSGSAERNERVIRNMLIEEIKGALKMMKCGKAACLYSTLVKFLKRRGISIIDKLLEIFNKCMETGFVPKDWKVAYIVPLYKG